MLSQHPSAIVTDLVCDSPLAECQPKDKVTDVISQPLFFYIHTRPDRARRAQRQVLVHLLTNKSLELSPRPIASLT